MSRERNLAKNTAILTIGKLCTQGINFFLLPLYTAVLETSEYGTFDLMVTYGTLLLPLVGMQMDQGLFRHLLECRDDKDKQTQIFTSVLISDVIQIMIYSIIVLGIGIIAKIKHYPFLIAYVCLHVISSLLMQFVRGLGKTKVYAVSSFISASTTVALNAFFLVVIKLGLEGLFISTLLATLISISYMIIQIKAWNYVRLVRFSKEILKKIRNYSLPLIPNNLSWWVVSVSDRTIVSYILGVAVNGIYTVSNKFSNLFITFYNIFNLSWTETVSLHFQDEDRDIFFSKMITTMFNLFSCACFGIIAIMPFIYPIMINAKYAEGYNQVFILMIAMLFRVVVGLYSCIYVAAKDTKKIATTSIISAVINIVVNLALIFRIGLYAASISTLVAFGTMAIVRYIDINRIIKMKIKTDVLISSIVIIIFLSFTYYLNYTLLNVVAFLLVLAYSIFVNKDLIYDSLKLVKRHVG